MFKYFFDRGGWRVQSSSAEKNGLESSGCVSRCFFVGAGERYGRLGWFLLVYPVMPSLKLT